MCRNDAALQQFKVNVVASALRASCCTPRAAAHGVLGWDWSELAKLGELLMLRATGL